MIKMPRGVILEGMIAMEMIKAGLITLGVTGIAEIIAGKLNV